MATRRTRAVPRSKKPERVGLGGGSVDRHLATRHKRGPSVWMSVGDGNTVTVRAVDTETYFLDGYVHPVEFERKDGSSYSMDVRCLDPDDEGNPCPGCRDDLERRYKFWMVVIWRDAPLENKAGKVIGEADQVRILSGANRLVKALNSKHKRRSLDRRDIEISQSGTGFDVEYEAEWATDEDVPLSRDDKELIKDATAVIEAFERYTKIPDEDEFYDPPTRSDDDDEDIGERSRRRGSVFNKERNKAKRSTRSEPDDDSDGAKPMRRLKAKPKPTGISAARSKAASGTVKKRRIQR